jgi:hypothetical protein
MRRVFARRGFRFVSLVWVVGCFNGWRDGEPKRARVSWGAADVVGGLRRAGLEFRGLWAPCRLRCGVE